MKAKHKPTVGANHKINQSGVQSTKKIGLKHHESLNTKVRSNRYEQRKKQREEKEEKSKLAATDDSKYMGKIIKNQRSGNQK